MSKLRLLVLVLLALVTAGCAGTSANVPGAAQTSSDYVADTDYIEPAAVYTGSGKRPNIVFVLMDDASIDLLRTMRSGRYMARHGASYDHAYVVDSLCCPSRAATLSGQYPHQNGVLTNTHGMPNKYGPLGGRKAFVAHGSEQRTFALRMQGSGYTTGLVGKYLNGLGAGIQGKPNGTKVKDVPPGWTEFRALMGSAYDGWKYEATEPDGNGGYRVRAYDAPRSATKQERDERYAGTVTEKLALDFVRRHEDDKAPYFLYVGTYAPHGRIDENPAYADDPLFPPAFRDRAGKRHPHGNCGLVDCRDLTVDDLPGFGDARDDNQPSRADGSLAPHWNVKPKEMTPEEAQKHLRHRARMVQSVDRMVMRILRAVGKDTYVVLTSDNGYHLGQYGLTNGKGTPYDGDIRVPLLVVGPGVVPGPRSAMVSNIDWAATFEELAGIETPAYRSGISMVPTFSRPHERLLEYTFVEHTFSRSRPGRDPDRPFTGGGLNVIPSYLAVRSRTSLLVRFDLDRSWAGTDYAYEFYDLTTQSSERVNQFADPAYADQVSELMAKLQQFDACQHTRDGQPVTADCRQLTQQQ